MDKIANILKHTKKAFIGKEEIIAKLLTEFLAADIFN